MRRRCRSTALAEGRRGPTRRTSSSSRAVLSRPAEFAHHLGMHWPTALFLLALLVVTATRVWLASRQIAAVQAHRDRVPELFRDQIALPDQQKAADYAVARMRLGSVASAVEGLNVLGFTLGGGIAALDAALSRVGWHQPWHGAAVLAIAFALLLVLIRLPLSIWRTFRLEARFGFNRSTPALFAADVAKRLGLTLALGTPLAVALLALMERAGRWWWLWAWLVWLVMTLSLSWAWPRFIAPLFNRFTPLADEALRARVEALVRRCGFTSSGVFVMDGSRRSTHGNAYFTGVGGHKRIVLFDTLMAGFGAAEVEAVVAHELGHFRLHHVRQGLLLSAIGALTGLALLAWLAEQPSFYVALGVPRSSPHAALLLFTLVVPVFTYWATPMAAWWSRRHELAADDFAGAHVDPAALAGALTKLYRDNASTLTPDRLHSAFYDSHPPALARIARLQALTTERRVVARAPA